MESNSTLNRRERKKQETKQKIIKIAMYLFRKNGFDSTSMEQISEDVDISKATLYNYFPVKEAIISEYWQNNVKELKLQLLQMIQLLPDTKKRLEKTFTKAASELFKSKQDIYKIYLSFWFKNIANPSYSKNLKSGFEDIFSMIIKLGQQGGDIRRDTSVELMVKHLEVSFLTACMSWLSDPKLFPLEKTLTDTVSLFIEGSGTGARKAKSKTHVKGSSGNLDQGSLL
jgi:AcrR family transcriptional regulator